MYFSIIIPVYNRPDEIKELLESLLISDFNKPYEIVIVEDGSSIPCKNEIEDFKNKWKNYCIEHNIKWFIIGWLSIKISWS